MKKLYKYNINSIRSTNNLAIELQKLIKPDLAILLNGEIGSGKSTLTKFIIESLNTEFQGSPTFGLVHHYSLNNELNLVHADLYRDSESIIEYLMQYNNCAYIIEWPNEEMAKFFPSAIRVEMNFDGQYRYALVEVSE